MICGTSDRFDIVLDVIHSLPEVGSAPDAYPANEVAATESGLEYAAADYDLLDAVRSRNTSRQANAHDGCRHGDFSKRFDALLP